MKLKSICVYCGSRPGIRESYGDSASFLGKIMAEKGIKLIYGGGSNGLMGAVARSAIGHGGKVIGIIPVALMDEEISGEGVGDKIIVSSMHERKAKMAEESDAFIALPGGFGTLEELMETITWSQLGIHSKPVGLLNIHGFYDGLLSFLDHCVDEGFISSEMRESLVSDSDCHRLLEKLESYEAKHSGVNTKEMWEKGKEIII